MADNGNRNRTADHSRIARAAESVVFRLAARVITVVATMAMAVVGWLWTERERLQAELWTDLKSTVESTADDVSDLSDYTSKLSRQFEVLGLTVQDHERRIRRAELTSAPPWRGRDQ